MFPAKNLRDDQDELRKIFQRFRGTFRPLTYLRENLTVREFVQVVNFLPDLEKQISCGGFSSPDFNSMKSEREILIFFGESENVITPHASSKSSRISTLSSPEKFLTKNESCDKEKKILVSKYSLLSSRESLMSSRKSYQLNAVKISRDFEGIKIESSEEIILKVSHKKASLIPKMIAKKFQDCPRLKPSKAFMKTRKMLLISAIIAATILVMKFVG